MNENRVSLLPKVDVHAHALGPKAAYVGIMDALNVRTVMNLSYSGFREPDALADYEAALRCETAEHPGRFLFAPTFNVTRFSEPEYVNQVLAKLRADVTDRGAVALKVWKDVGMTLQDTDGRYVFCDDARFSPIFEFAQSHGLVVHLHIADPLAGWLPLDPTSPHYHYYRNHPEFHWHGRTDTPSHGEILAHRDALVARYPDLRFVACHLASLEHDLELVGAFLDAHPNAFVDTSARIGDLQRMPDDEVRGFLDRYQDRVLYGSDWEYDEETFSSDPERGQGEMETCIGRFRQSFDYFETRLALPEIVLRRFYFDNAAELYALV